MLLVTMKYGARGQRAAISRKSSIYQSSVASVRSAGGHA
jgi:hypothetical protein